MNTLIVIFKRKPPIFVIISILYILAVSFLKWRFTPELSTLWFVIGSLVGIYFMDIAETLFNVTPSPFRTILFAGAFTIVSFFVVTSSGNDLSSGLVLSLFCSMILSQIGELKALGNLHSWYSIVNASISTTLEKWGTVVLFLVFFFETVIYIRS